MPLGYHIQNRVDLNNIPEIQPRLYQIYENVGEPLDDSLLNVSRKIDHLYIGDEFCIHRLPALSRLEKLLAFSEHLDLPVTLLTPVVSDFGIDICRVLFDYLADNAPGTEIVVNDWGMVLLLKEHFPVLPVSLGRLLNKGIKDPRVTFDQIASSASKSMFNSSTFDLKAFQKQAQALDIKRFERDLLPHGGDLISNEEDMPISIYFPYGYATTGRICRTAALTGKTRERFAINSHCAKVCENVQFEMKHADYAFNMIQSGNTVFYLYPPGVCQSLLAKEKPTNDRLIFQDLMPASEVVA